MTTPNEPEPAAAADESELDVDDSTLDPRAREALQKARREAHSLRTRLREAEEEVGAAAAVVGAMQLAEVKRIAGEHLIDPDDLLTHQPDIQAYYDEEFKQIVPDRVREATQALIAARPHLGKPNTSRPPSDRPIESLRGGASPQDKPAAPSWFTAIRGAGA